ncbi:hypothetical protein Y032_0033g2698 [Ancylostoma ceylanicum]|uniref:Uncharacterized protein n=1 Tax=Ancylostoma ceylanicum TaxID=53326 RepID=A0A016UMV6_9BILA|nr:hypothetical protein Y032_0033g2698 [Ancylostoma ceylanicum]
MRRARSLQKEEDEPGGRRVVRMRVAPARALGEDGRRVTFMKAMRWGSVVGERCWTGPQLREWCVDVH